MKRLLLIIPLLVLALCTRAQNPEEDIWVTSVRLLENDLTAQNRKTKRIDQNGEEAALIKIQTTKTGFGFECGSLGVVEVRYQTGEIWLYVPAAGVKRLTITHPIYGTMRDYYFQIPIEGSRTYEMLISLPQVDMAKEDANFVAVTLQPTAAELVIDNAIVKPDEHGYYTARGSMGSHSFKASMEGYKPQSGNFEIDESGVKMLNINLKPITAPVHVTCPTPGSQIYVDGKLVGKDDCTIDLPIGHEYEITATKQGFGMTGRTITVSEASKGLTVDMDALLSLKKDAWNPKSAVFLSALVGGPRPISYGLRAGWCAKIGGYIKGRSNFDFTSASNTVTPEGLLPDGTIFAASGNTATSYWVATAGVMFKTARWLYLYGGLGYSSYNELWEAADDSWAKVSTTSGNGIAADLGVIFKIKYLTLSVGATYSAPKAIEGEIGIGVAF